MALSDIFKPDPSVLAELNLTKNDRYFILRETSHITNHLQFQVINIDDDEGNNTSSK